MNETQTNKTTITIITSTIAILAFCCVATICFLAYFGIKIPPELNTLAGVFASALTAMLVKTTPTETTKQPQPTAPVPPGPQEVQVVNQPADPVPTTTEPKKT